MAGDWTDWLKNSRYLYDEKVKSRKRSKELQAEFDRTVDEAMKEYRDKRKNGEKKREKDPNAEYHHGRKMKAIGKAGYAAKKEAGKAAEKEQRGYPHSTRPTSQPKSRAVTMSNGMEPSKTRTRKKNIVGEGKDFEATPMKKSQKQIQPSNTRRVLKQTFQNSEREREIRDRQMEQWNKTQKTLQRKDNERRQWEQQLNKKKTTKK